jgi:uncharacterized protein involved in cysteine biosynthesis
MLSAFFRALGVLFDGRILGILGACVLLSLGCFVLAWFGMQWLLDTAVAETGALRTSLDVLGGLAALVGAWFLFPMVASSFVCLFLDRVARVVEARDYRDLPPAAGLPLLPSIGNSLRFLAVVVAANLLLLLLWFFPPAYPIGYVVVNGMLLGREYFELVALRRLDTSTARELRRNHAAEIWLAGVGFAALSAVPVVNLVLPVLATATLVHRFEHWRRNQR